MKFPVLWYVMLACSLGIIALALWLVGAHHDLAAVVRGRIRSRRFHRNFKWDGPRP